MLKNISKDFYPTSVRYDVLKEIEAGKAVIKSAIKHWETLGFLMEIDDEQKKEELAVAFDNITNDFLFENRVIWDLEKKYQENIGKNADFTVIIYPVLRRIICGVSKVDDDNGIDNFSYDKFLEYLDKMSWLSINTENYNHETDIEAEYTALLSSAITKLFKNEK